MSAVADLLAELGSIPFSADPAFVQAKSRDMYAISPLLRRALKGHSAEAVIAPRTTEELRRVLSLAVRHGVPLTPRGGGTANYGQSVPLAGGAMLDMTGFIGITAIGEHTVRVKAGTLMGDIDRALRPHGKELRLHPSTRADSTIAGFIAGGSGGMGSVAWGMLRDPGNIAAVQVMSVEAAPRLVELTGPETLLVQHAYGTNGVITELELPLAPARDWMEVVLGFDDVLDAASFGFDFAAVPGMPRKLASVQQWPVPRMMRALGGIVPEGQSMVLCMVGASHLQKMLEMAAALGGRAVSIAREGQGPYGAPLYEFAFGHALRQIQKHQPRITVLQAMLPPGELMTRMTRLEARMRGIGPLRCEIFYSAGKLVAMASPYVAFESEAQLAALVDALQEEGLSVANSHTTGVRAVGIKRLDDRDALFKRAMDPHGLLNPGKLDLEKKEAAATTTLATKGWTVQPPMAASNSPETRRQYSA